MAKAPDMLNFAGGVCLCLVAIALFIWGIYGMLCIHVCGATEAKCSFSGVEVRVEVCQTENKAGWTVNLPYTGYSSFCFRVNLPGHDPNSTVCSERQVSCSNTQKEALDKANALYPPGTVLNCWYQIASFEGGGLWFYIYWDGLITRMNDMFNGFVVYSLVVAGLLILVLIVAMFYHLCRNEYLSSAADKELARLI